MFKATNFITKIRSRSGFDSKPMFPDPSIQSLEKSERLYIHRVETEKEAKRLLKIAKLPNTADNFFKQTKIEKMSPINK